MEPQNEDVTKKMEELKVDEGKKEEEKKEDQHDEEEKHDPVQHEGEVEVAEGVQEFKRNQASKFLCSTSSWEDEKMNLPVSIKQALVDA